MVNPLPNKIYLRETLTPRHIGYTRMFSNSICDRQKEKTQTGNNPLNRWINYSSNGFLVEKKKWLNSNSTYNNIDELHNGTWKSKIIKGWHDSICKNIKTSGS